MQIHTWTRAWNRDPSALQVLAKLKAEGKILAVGVSTPEHDQNAVIDLMRQDLVDSVQVIYNIFERECEAEILPVAKVKNVAVIARCPFDESSLCGKLSDDTRFDDRDFRARYFKGDRLRETVDRVEKVRETLSSLGEHDMPSAALRFCLAQSAVACVIPGVRTAEQARANSAASEAPALDPVKIRALREHIWRRGFWYA
jgi:aryl-alcohol dehydrogenase-like predicted oxidoreductase